MKNSFIRTTFFTFLFCAGNLLTTHFVIAQDENSQEAVVHLDEINIFDNQEGELLDPDWQDLELKLVQLQETIQEVTQVEVDESEPSDPEEQIAERSETETQMIKTQETEFQEAEPDEPQLQEAVDDDTQVETDESESSALDEQAAEQPEAETQEIDAQVADLQESELKETIEDDAQGEGIKATDTVELNGDTVEYSIDGNKIIAQGNVIVNNKEMDLYCDRIEFSRDTSMAYATGNVRLVMKKGEASEMTGEKLTFNFKTMEGGFDGAHIYAKPYYGYGGKVSKAGENHMRMEDNYVTTCDLDKPHYRLTSKKMDIYPGDKLVARSIRMLVGNLPMLYLPKMTQDLTSKEPRVTFTPGYTNDWGMFLLSDWRYKINENIKGIIHVDAREKKDIAWGIDVNYIVPKGGDGQVRTYYMNERNITSDRFYQERPSPTIEKERYGIEWRHKWEMDNKTNAILQYVKLSDSSFLKDYFERVHKEDSSPSTYFLLTRILPRGSVSFRTDIRVNRFESKIERLPEIRYDLGNQPLFDSGFYLRNTTIYSNFTNKTASPSEVRQSTMRVDMDSAISYPMKIGFIELNPFVGGRNTYYSKTKDPDKYGTIRGIFNTGASLSTRFYKVFDTKVQRFGLNINRLRHIITPSANYKFSSKPTRTSDQLDSFDEIDNLDIEHTINFSIENKLQTKRNNKTVELLRAIISTDFRLKEHQSKGGFDQIKTDIDFRPVDWITFYFDSNYDTRRDHLTTANFDMYINGGEKWSVNVGKRWNREVDDQLTADFNYKFNPKWAFRAYTRFDLRNGILKEQEYAVVRDLHAWTMDLNFNETREEGNEIWIVFTLKAFPEMIIDFGTSFNKRKAGSQSSEGD